MIGNVDQVNKDYGLKLTKDEFNGILVPAWLSVADGSRVPVMTEDEFVKWYKKDKANRLIAGALAKMWGRCFEQKQELQDAKIKLADLAVDDYLLQRLDQTEKFIKQARGVLLLLQGINRAESEAKNATSK